MSAPNPAPPTPPASPALISVIRRPATGRHGENHQTNPATGRAKHGRILSGLCACKGSHVQTLWANLPWQEQSFPNLGLQRQEILVGDAIPRGITAGLAIEIIGGRWRNG